MGLRITNVLLVDDTCIVVPKVPSLHVLHLESPHLVKPGVEDVVAAVALSHCARLRR